MHGGFYVKSGEAVRVSRENKRSKGLLRYLMMLIDMIVRGIQSIIAKIGIPLPVYARGPSAVEKMVSAATTDLPNFRTINDVVSFLSTLEAVSEIFMFKCVTKEEYLLLPGSTISIEAPGAEKYTLGNKALQYWSSAYEKELLKQVIAGVIPEEIAKPNSVMKDPEEPMLRLESRTFQRDDIDKTLEGLQIRLFAPISKILCTSTFVPYQTVLTYEKSKRMYTHAFPLKKIGTSHASEDCRLDIVAPAQAISEVIQDSATDVPGQNTGTYHTVALDSGYDLVVYGVEAVKNALIDFVSFESENEGTLMARLNKTIKIYKCVAMPREEVLKVKELKQ